MTLEEQAQKAANDVAASLDIYPNIMSKEIILAALKQVQRNSAQVARDSAKRYTCNHKKGICRAIGDAIEGQK